MSPSDDFTLPDVGEGLDQAEIVEWLVAEGEEVTRDQPLVEILTDKSQTQLPAPKAGRIKRLLFAEGDIAGVGQVLVEYEAAGGSEPADHSEGDRELVAEPETTDDAPPPVTGSAPATSAAGGSGRTQRRPKASPVVRKRAVEAGIDLHTVRGTGPGGRITVDDLDAVLTRPARAAVPTSAPGTTPANPAGAPAPADTLGQIEPGTHPLRGIRRVTAEAMAISWAVPHIHGADEFDATSLLDGRRRIKELQPDRAANLTPLAFFVMAVADALRRYPLVNASLVPGESIVVHDEVNIGIAVATEAGLIVPVIRNADHRTLFDLSDEITRLSRAARDRSITGGELRGGTCTISNYGSLGGRYATPIIRAPEAAIVGFGSIRPRPIVIDGVVVARPTLPIAVAADHRLIDGDLMTAFQEHIISMLSNPVALLAR